MQCQNSEARSQNSEWGRGLRKIRVFCLLKESVRYYTADPKTGRVSRETTPTASHIILAHELIHADRNAHGVAIPDIHVDGGLQVINREWHAFRDRNGVVQLVRALTEEMITTGLPLDNRRWDITENDIRIEHGFWLRGVYK